jgi:hypothetical protein
MPKYDYYLIENTYVARFDSEALEAEQLMPDGTWILSIRTTEICNGRPLKDEKHALDMAAFLIERDKKREAAKRGERREPRDPEA